MVGCASDVLPHLPSVADAPYRLNAGDKLKITVFGDQSISGEYAVDGEGDVSLPLVGVVGARDKTLAAFRTEVENRLASNYLRNPHVAAEVIGFRPVYILGSVTNPGEYPYVERMTVYSLAARAGGFTYRAAHRYIFVRHRNEAVETRYALDSGTAVQPGDTIRVGERVF